MAKKRILFVAEAVTLAHVARPTVLARALNPDNYEVYLACDPRFNKLFPKSPLSHRGIHSISGEKFLNALGRNKPVYDTDTLRAYVAEDLSLIEEITPDLVVGDFRLSLAVSAPLSRVPYMTISNAYWSPFARPHFSVPELPLTKIAGVRIAQLIFDLIRPAAFAIHTLPLNKIRKEHGLAPLGRDMRQIYTWADHTLYADIPSLIPTYALPPSHHYLGPILWSPSVTLPDWWETLPSDRPIVYVTFGSSGRSDLLPIVFKALADMPVTVIAATAGRIQLNRIPNNVFIADYLPSDGSVSRAQLVICNGGSPTTQQALGYGVPVLGIPSNLDQHLNMDVVMGSAAGRRLRSEKVTEPEIRKTVASMLDSPDYSRAAQRLAQLFSKYDAASRFAALVAQVLK